MWRLLRTRRAGLSLAGGRTGCFRARSGAERIVLLAALLLAAFPPRALPTAGAAQSATEFQVKAAYLLNFLRFVEWPDDSGADPHASWIIGFVGDTPVSDELARLVEGKSVLGRDLQVRKFQPTENLRACNILFISESEKKRLPAILATVRGSSVLTVADMENFISSGGMVALVMEDSRVKVAIDVAATGRAHLKVSSKLLALAHLVAGPERGAAN
ncbi:MAG TPA: YfiR family protein [Candidatus Acidoferrales bacterium]|nr:YfiR family protein [Candidatus Acidoferrales bacterium]